MKLSKEDAETLFFLNESKQIATGIENITLSDY